MLFELLKYKLDNPEQPFSIKLSKGLLFISKVFNDENPDKSNLDKELFPKFKSNIDEVYNDLVSKGVKFHCPPKDFGSVKATYGRDIDGNVFEIQEIIAPDHPAKVFKD